MPPMFVPGPVDVAPEILAAQSRPMLPHRAREFEAIFHRAADKSRAIFGTQARVFLNASSGSGLHEAAVRNFVHKKMLVCANGAFAKRWHDVAVSNGKDADLLDVDWQSPILPEHVGQAVKGKGYEAVAFVHNETSTGLMNPAREIAAAIREASPDSLILVDAVSSLGGVEMCMDDWGIDFVLTSSQKCLALPPGLSLAAVNDRALEKAKTVENRGWYFDFVRLETHRVKDTTPATPAIGLVYALDVQMDRIMTEGLENRFARHRAMAECAQSWAAAHGFGLYAPEGYRSHTVTTLVNTPGIDMAGLKAFLLERDMRIAGGYGKIKDTTFRIGHMGELTVADVQALLAAFEEFMGGKG
ncbi:MAG: alanine--glyoxylate aminotransferase family protein [Chloroflexi bacterium]|nr:alanine--glyoxylate aminotransferase family protein [Chloroflexota bacterium]